MLIGGAGGGGGVQYPIISYKYCRLPGHEHDACVIDLLISIDVVPLGSFPALSESLLRKVKNHNTL